MLSLVSETWERSVRINSSLKPIPRIKTKKLSLANEATDKELISETYKQLLQLNSRKINDPMKRMGQRTKQKFLQIRHTDG